jgi:hypothetical protein
MKKRLGLGIKARHTVIVIIAVDSTCMAEPEGKSD